MKKLMLLTLIMGTMPLSMLAQDDMYFVPSKKSANKTQVARSQIESYYSGSSRSVDEYNRRGSAYEVLPDSDIINFNGEVGVYPDSISDFALTEKMTRFDDYVPTTSYWEGYSDGRRDSWGWHSPWYYSSYYPWYDSWYDPWYYGYSWYSPWYYHGWYDPWYGYGWGGYYSSWYYRPWHYYGGWYGGRSYTHYSRYNPAGTRNHGYVRHSGNTGFSNGRTHSYSRGSFGSGRTVGTFGATRNSRTTGTNSSSRGVRSYGNSGSTYSNSQGNFGGSRSNSGSYSNRSYSPSNSSSSSGSFGGSRSSGGSFGGGSRSSGGGHSGGFGSGRR